MMWIRTQFRSFINIDDSAGLEIVSSPVLPPADAQCCMEIRNICKYRDKDIVIWQEWYRDDNKIAVLKCEYVLDYISDYLIRNEVICNLKQIDFCLESSPAYKELQGIQNNITTRT